jgi:2-keto-4-pentenoate hydratase
MKGSKFLTVYSLALEAVCVLGILLLLGGLACTKSNKTPDKSLKMIEEMVSGRETRTPIKPLTQTYGSFSIEEAYHIQSLLAKELSKTLGDVIGYKVAYASKAPQEQFGIDEPASGPYFKLQQIPDGATLESSDFVGLVMETEVAFTIGRRIDQPLDSVEALKPYVKYVHASFDIGDDRFDPQQQKPGLSDVVASGTGAYRFILGPAMDPEQVDVDKIILKLIVNGKMVAESSATNVMGSPWNSLLWLVNRVVSRGYSLEIRDVVLTGTAAPAYRAKGSEAAGTYEGDCGPLGKVTCTIQ